MCAQVADHSRCMDALGEFHAKGIHHGNLNKFNILITPGNEVVFMDCENPTLTTTTTTTTSGCPDSEIIPIAGPPPQTKLLQQVKELVETGLVYQRLFCAKIPDSCYIQPHP